MVATCKKCGRKGVEGAMLDCGCWRPVCTAIDTSIKPTRRKVGFRKSPSSDTNCVHRDANPVGITNCGCSGKYKAYWCNKLEGHCTLTSTGKVWTKIETPTGIISRLNLLKPCLHCVHRSTKSLTIT